MGYAGRGGQELSVGGGHGGGQYPRQHDPCQQRRQHSVPAHKGGNAHKYSLGGGGAFKGADSSGAAHGKAHETGGDGKGHGDDHPCGTHPAGGLEPFPVLNGHKVVEDVGHAAVAKPPGKGGNNGQKAVFPGNGGEYVSACGKAQIPGHGAGVLHHSAPTPGGVYAEDEDNHQCHGHDHALDKAGDGGRHKAAHNTVGHDNRRAYHHGGHIAHVKKRGEELAAGGKAGGGVGHEKHDDNYSGDALDKAAVIPVAVGEEIGNGDGVNYGGVLAQTLGNDEPVKVCSHRKADDRPCGVGQTAEIRKPGHAHQQPPAHVRGLGAQRHHKGVEFPAAQIEIGGALVALGVEKAHGQHTRKIYHYGDYDENVCACHGVFLFS